MSRNPSEVCLIDADVKSIAELNLRSTVLSLNLHCNLLKNIEGLDSLRNLKHLDLSSNAIEAISGLDGLIFLKYLNLSCNKISVVEGLESLRQLAKLDLSYNIISNLSGLKSLSAGPSCLATLYLQGNQIQSIDHIIDCLGDFNDLKDLVFTQNEDSNPVCNHPKYRSLLLSMLSKIQVLDGLNRSGQQVDSDYSDHLGLTDIDDYVRFLASSPSNGSTKAEHGGSSTDTTTPRINEVLSKFRSQKLPVVDDDAKSRTQTTSANVKVALSADHEVRLERLEHQLAHILYKPAAEKEIVNKDPVREGTSESERTSKKNVAKISDSDTDNKNPSNSSQAYPKYRRVVSPAKTRLQSNPKDKSEVKMATRGKRFTAKKRQQEASKPRDSTTSGNEGEDGRFGDSRPIMVEGKKYVRHPEDDATFLSLIQELDLERERRWKAEQAALKLVEHVKDLQIKVNEEKKLENAALTASTRLKEALQKARQEKTELQKINTSLQAKYEEMVDDLKNCRETEEEQKKALRAMEAASAKLETERMQQHAHEVSRAQEQQMRAAALARELDILKTNNKQLTGQVQQLQELLATREQQHKVEMEGLVRPDSRDMREVIDKEIVKTEARFEQLMKQWDEKLRQKNRDYAELENEFRMALQIEAKRFQELQDEFTKVSEECSQYKQISQAARQKETKATGMVSELTSLVKEQKVRITELTKSKQESLSQHKERINVLEEETKVARKRISRIEVLEQDKSKLLSQVRAQESVIQGLRLERKLWGEELAQQGASLAQDRGRLESKVESLAEEKSLLQKQLENANDSIRIKSKMLEDQTESIRQLKQSLSEFDSERQKNEESERNKLRDIEERLEQQHAVNQELEEKNESLLQRKEELKDELSVLQSELEKSEETKRSLKSKWQERSDLIGRLEQEVKEMRNQFDAKEEKMVEEKEKAIKAGNLAIEKLHSCDDAFRKQLEKQKEVYEREIDRLTREKEEVINQSNQKINEVEDEMRQILQEAASGKKTLEMRIKKLTNAFNEIQEDLTS
ncbi:leucine-rich repeat and coiled-coil domain-containing protein 1-like [Dendronephthya gigantea]|uniref:leucine-rich repeat and coiled-coil domain-containing protein 1-like n=1 Tax=Dendronephthya gigantea TaxID=151771 RepID=UPI00106DAEF9|nr:leucine-rich repeat and coiled-coil domain-containing protein 1-like [Dendronephthya gigantea]